MAFFDDFGKRFSDITQNVANQTKSMAGVVQLTKEISDKEKKINKTYETMGKLLYDQCKDSAPEIMAEHIALIDALKNEIETANEKIRQLKEVKETNEVREDVKVEEAVQVNTEQPENLKHTCAVCGAELHPEAAFCINCGSKVE